MTSQSPKASENNGNIHKVAIVGIDRGGSRSAAALESVFLMEEQDPTQTSLEVEEVEVVEREQEQQGKISEEENVVRFLDSVDSYLTLLDSLSSTLRQVNRSSIRT